MTKEIPSGLQLPPQDVQKSIDKTVSYVVKNGPSFELRLKENNKDGKFDFLIPDKPYHEYYRWKLSVESETVLEQTEISRETNNVTELQPQIPIETPSPLPFLTTLPMISMLDLDVIKITALFVARNGSQYLTKLVSHQKSLGNLAQFEFTNKLHSFNKLFLQYIDQYKLVLELFKSKDDSLFNNPDKLLEIANNRAQYNKQHKQEVQTKRKQEHEKRLHYASIDWQDFAVIGTIEFTAVDAVQELPIPLNREDLLYRSLESKQHDIVTPLQKRKEEVDNVDQSPPPAPVPQKMKGMKIKAAGESRLKKSSPTTNSIKCPITGKMIPQDKFDDHLRVLLRDPRYKQEQENFMKKNFTYSSNLTTDQVYENIKRLVSKRSGESIEQVAKRPQLGPS
jgi:splicing factor 3A subunit 1